MKKTHSHSHSHRPSSFLSSYHDSYSYSCPWPIRIYDDEGIYHSPTFLLGKSSWQLHIFPLGVDNSGEYLAIHLVSLAQESLTVSYSLTIEDQHGDDHCHWKDPEETVVFSSISEGNNEWGVDEMISIEDLERHEGYIVNHTMIIQITMTVYGRDDLNSHEVLVNAIEKAGESKSDLIKLANADLEEAVSRLPTRRNLKAQKSQEDHIVRARGGK